MDTNEMIALLLPPNGCYKCSDTRKEIAEELARRSVDLERECADADKICAALGLTVEQARTEGGALNVPRIVAHINETLTALRESHAFGVAMSDKYVAQVRATAREPETISAMLARHDRESREAILRTYERMSSPPAQAEPQEGDLLHTMMEWARTEEGRKQLADSYRPHLWACAKRVADPQNEAATCRHWCGDIEHCQPIASAPAQAEPQPEHAGPIAWLRTLNGDPDWQEDCVHAYEDDARRNLNAYIEGAGEGEVYSIIPLYAAPPAEAAPDPLDALRDAGAKAEQAAIDSLAESPRYDIARKLHYPEHWDTAAYPTLESAIWESLALNKCSECYPMVEVAPAQEGAKLTGWGLLLKPPIKHLRGCAFVTMDSGKVFEPFDESCTCGYEWRVRCADYMTQYNAWRKRAEEAEIEAASLRSQLAAMKERANAIEDEGVIERLREGRATAQEQFDVANSLAYLWAQDGLLTDTQKENERLREQVAEMERPLDAQMALLNKTVAEKNNEALALQRQLTATQAELAAAREDAKVGAAIQRAAAELPEGFDIEINVERGAASVTLYDPDEAYQDMDVDADNRLAAEINAAIDAARRA